MSIFKDCDIRGIYDAELTNNDAYLIGRAVGTLMTGKTLAVGGDVRISTPALKELLIRGLVESGVRVTDLGMVPTPVFYFSIGHLGTDGGIMVTASHNPARYNGFKLMLGDMPVTPRDIAAIEELVGSRAFTDSVRGEITTADVDQAYRRFAGELAGPSDLKIVVDAGNGAVSRLAPLMAREQGCEVVPLFCEFDGTFPGREPNPAVYSNLGKLREKVVEAGADIGAGFDGDGDRVVFVDEKGQVITSEQSLCVFLGHYIREPGDSVVYDLKSSSIVKKTAEKLGGQAIMERSGHAFIKRTFLQNRSALAGEISGHFFFRELGHDDGIYAMLKMCELVAAHGRPLSDIIADVPVTLITPDIRLHWPYGEQDALLEAVSGLGRYYPVTRMDGIRIEFPRGWLLVRKSVTEEGVTLRMEADDNTALREIIDELLRTAPALRGRHELFK